MTAKYMVNYGKVRRKLKPAEKGSLLMYTRGGYENINRVLREERPTKHHIVEPLQSALNKLPAYKGTVYRSVWFEKKSPQYNKFLGEHKEGQVVQSKQFTSTTSNKLYAIQRERGIPNTVFMKIKAKGEKGKVIGQYHSKGEENVGITGQPRYCASEEQRERGNPGVVCEKEVLYPPGTQFRVKKKLEGKESAYLELEEE